MGVLSASELTKSHADQPILRGVTFALEDGEKVALIGRNGSGKTTLLRLLAGLDVPDRGRVGRPAWVRVAYLAQTPEGTGGTPLMAHVLTGAAEVQGLEQRVRALEHRMSIPEVHDDPVRLKEALDEYAHVHDRFERAGGFTLQVRARTILTGLGFRPDDDGRPVSTLSGGWRVRAELARVLLADPDVLLLDEPTNHLDLTATEWLEEYLRALRSAVLIVSHDRYLLDAVTTRTLELEDGRVESYPGAYSIYAHLKAERVRRLQETWERQQEEIAKFEDYIRRYRVSRPTLAKSREKMRARVLETAVERPRRAPTLRVKADSAPASGRIVARLVKVSRRFDDRTVLRDLSLEIYRGERIGLLGPNGAGKTTLLRMLAGIDGPTSGQVSLGAGVRPRYFAQEAMRELDADDTVLDAILADRPMTPEQVRTHLGRFLFSGEDVFKRVGMLSGGERQRLNLARLLLERANLLLLDEPTNHLDIPSREALEAALREFPGTMIIATHDRYLLARLANRVLTVEEGTVSDFQGTYGDMRERRAREAAQPGRTAPRRATPPRAPKSNERSPAAAVSPTFDELAEQITAAEQDLAEAAGWLGDPDLYRDPERARAMRRRYEDAERRVTRLYEAMEKLEAGNST